ncbi:MAG: hypothetical protein WA823_16450 [Candidatus Acidiferrales bacterium]
MAPAALRSSAQARIHIRIARFTRSLRFSRAIFCLALAAAAPALFARQSPADSAGDIRVSPATPSSPPHLVFACDGAIADIEHLFDRPEVIPDLKQLGAGVALALPDFSLERAQLVLRLDQAGIPVTAWLSLPPEQGYYMNAGNARDAIRRLSDFEQWTSAYGLRWAGVGLDMEPNLQEFAALKNNKWRIAGTLIERYFSVSAVERARESYAAIVAEIRRHGYAVETYQFPFIADERAVHSTLLERLAGIVDVRSDREVLMLYTSFHPSLDSALIWAYGPDAHAILVGSTTGPDSAEHFARLNWESLSRDLLVAHHFSRVVGVYNLAGCVQYGFLSRLQTFDWDQTVVIPAASAQRAQQLRARIQRAIWIVSNLSYFAVAFFIVALALVVLRRERRRAALALGK